jgi:hypothetical protein
MIEEDVDLLNYKFIPQSGCFFIHLDEDFILVFPVTQAQYPSKTSQFAGPKFQYALSDLLPEMDRLRTLETNTLTAWKHT